MKEHPILFSGPMVKAILEGRKTQTRRVVRGLPKGIVCASALPESNYQYRFTDFDKHTVDLRCPYGRPQLPLEPPRDRLWVRETWKVAERNGNQWVEFRAGGCLEFPRGTQRQESTRTWKPSIFMPRWASRITLEITNVRVERLQEINEADAIAEGVQCNPAFPAALTNRTSFGKGWDKINGKRNGCAWSDNPWVWVIEFRRAESERS